MWSLVGLIESIKMAIFEVASKRKIVKERGILAAQMYMYCLWDLPQKNKLSDITPLKIKYQTSRYTRSTPDPVCRINTTCLWD